MDSVPGPGKYNSFARATLRDRIRFLRNETEEFERAMEMRRQNMDWAETPYQAIMGRSVEDIALNDITMASIESDSQNGGAFVRDAFQINNRRFARRIATKRSLEYDDVLSICTKKLRQLLRPRRVGPLEDQLARNEWLDCLSYPKLENVPQSDYSEAEQRRKLLWKNVMTIKFRCDSYTKAKAGLLVREFPGSLVSNRAIYLPKQYFFRMIENGSLEFRQQDDNTVNISSHTYLKLIAVNLKEKTELHHKIEFTICSLLRKMKNIAIKGDFFKKSDIMSMIKRFKRELPDYIENLKDADPDYQDDMPLMDDFIQQRMQELCDKSDAEDNLAIVSCAIYNLIAGKLTDDMRRQLCWLSSRHGSDYYKINEFLLLSKFFTDREFY